MGSNLKKWRTGIDSVDICPSPPRLRVKAGVHQNGTKWNYCICSTIHIGDHFWSSFWFSNKQHYLSLRFIWQAAHANSLLGDYLSFHKNKLNTSFFRCVDLHSSTWILECACVCVSSAKSLSDFHPLGWWKRHFNSYRGWKCKFHPLQSHSMWKCIHI